jgi:hypothetical protein
MTTRAQGIRRWPAAGLCALLVGLAGCADRQEELSGLMVARGDEMWPVAQTIVELLLRDNIECKALFSLLGTRVDLESRALRRAEVQWARTVREPEQLRL